MGRTCKTLHRQSTKLRIEPGTLELWGDNTTHYYPLHGTLSVDAVSSSTGPKFSCSAPDGTKTISPVSASLHWLPVRYRTEFTIFLFVFKSLHGLAPSYISDLICLQNTSRVLRLSNQLLLNIPWTRKKFKGDQAFCVSALRLWNSLPCL